MLSRKKYEKRNKLVENRLKKDQEIINDFSSKAQKVDRLEKCNELLMDALIKKSPNIVGAQEVLYGWICNKEERHGF